MKQIVLCLIGILFASFVSAQKINHPSLLYTPQRIQQVKQRMQNESKLREAWEDIQKTADEALQKKDFNRLDYLSLAYLMTDNKEYADVIKEILSKAVEAESWGDTEMLARIPVWRSHLGMAHKSFLSAIGYDAAYNIMSSSERKKIAEGLKRLAVEPALGDWLLEPTRIHSLNSMGHNWWTSCVCQGGILALSLQNELPEVKDWVEQLHESLPEWFDFAGDALQQKAKSFDEAGGMYESLNYANFGIQEALLFRIAWINTHPGQNPGDIPQLAKLPNYFSQVCYPRTGMLHSLNFGDSHKNVSAESSMMLLYALGLKDPTILWYIAQVEQGQHREKLFHKLRSTFTHSHRSECSVTCMAVRSKDHLSSACKHLTGKLMDDCLMRRNIDAAILFRTCQSKHMVIFIDRTTYSTKTIMTVRQYIWHREFFKS